MELFENYNAMLLYSLISASTPLITWLLYRLVKWGKGMSKGAFLFLAIFPLIAIFPIPPTEFKNVEKAKQERHKRKEIGGEPEKDDVEES